MWDRVTDIAKTAAAMLQSGKVPPNTPLPYQTDLGKVNFLASRKFFVVFTSILMLIVFYLASIFVLFLTAPLPTITAAFVTIFVETIKIFAIIISAYLGLQAAIDFKYNSSSDTSFRGENIIVTETYTDRIIEEGSPNAPKIRPFSTIYTEE